MINERFLFLSLGDQMNGINSMAMQQGGPGLILSILIVSAPPMAATFFQGTLAAFSSYSAFGNVGSQTAQRPPGAPDSGYVPPIANENRSTSDQKIPNVNLGGSRHSSYSEAADDAVRKK